MEELLAKMDSLATKEDIALVKEEISLIHHKLDAIMEQVARNTEADTTFKELAATVDDHETDIRLIVPLSIEWTHKTEKIMLHNGTYVRIDWACDTLWTSGSFFHYRNM